MTIIDFFNLRAVWYVLNVQCEFSWNQKGNESVRGSEILGIKSCLNSKYIIYHSKVKNKTLHCCIPAWPFSEIDNNRKVHALEQTTPYKA